jgi:osmoprotectant transport system ATP-binding protein
MVSMIRFEQVSKRYPDGTMAVDSLDLECPTGQITVLVGTSGCGKTTSLRMINRMVEPTSGRVLLDGVDVATSNAAELRRQMGYVIQQSGLFPHRTVLDNIATVPYLLGWNKRRARDRAAELLERVGLASELGRRYPYQLSGGQQQRVGVARALAADPPVMLMDEPFSAVDPVVRAELQQEFLRLQGELGKTIVFVTHDVDEAVKLGDRIAVFRVPGRLVQVASPEELLAAPADDFVDRFLGNDRGIRRLSFFGSDELALRDDGVVAAGATVEVARGLATAAGHRWLLVVDGQRRPVGWFDVQQGEAPAGLVPDGPPALAPVGHGFTPGTDSLRAALDGAVLSPDGRVAALDADGRAVGTASQDDIASAIRAAASAEHPNAGAPA